MGLPSPPTLSLGYNWSLTYLPPAQTCSQLTLQRCVTAPALPRAPGSAGAGNGTPLCTGFQAELDVFFSFKVWQGTALRGRLSWPHAFTSVKQPVDRTALLWHFTAAGLDLVLLVHGWKSASFSVRAQYTLQPSTLLEITAETRPLRPLVYYTQYEKSTAIHCYMKVEYIVNTWNLHLRTKSIPLSIQLWLYDIGVKFPCLTRNTRSMFLRQTVQRIEHNIWHVVCYHLGTY